MVMIQPDFIYGVVRKSLVLGVIAALVILFTVSAEVAKAVAVGALISAVNLRVVALSIRKMFERARDGEASSVFWTLVLALKMIVLMAVIGFLIAYIKLNAVGFVFGFSLFMPAIFWQMVVMEPDESEDEFSED